MSRAAALLSSSSRLYSAPLLVSDAQSQQRKSMHMTTDGVCCCVDSVRGFLYSHCLLSIKLRLVNSLVTPMRSH